ncbi:MAG: hypothetical protein D4R57_00060 [Verrucomicrobiales bacterium]|nr:MAG: hypothetical protein D4R57_00060 [Verrucomicrobiales bacterium]
MKTRSIFITKLMVAISSLAFLVYQSNAQILFSGGTYSQNFNSLPQTTGTNVWANNVTLPGWYSRSVSTVAAIGDGIGTTNILGGTGSGTAGAFYSFGIAGVNPVTERALGTICSGTSGAFAYGIRFTNNTGFALTNITIVYTGEQWRNGGNTSAQPLAFSYRVDKVAITEPDPAGTNTWTSVPSLNFTSPTVGATAGALDGNSPANRVVISNVISGFVLINGQEIFLRWLDINDAGNDHALALDDLSVSFETNFLAGSTAPTITTNPASVTIGAGGSATFTVGATGTQPFSYFWYATNSGLTDLVGTSASFTTNFVPLSASGYKFYVVLTNTVGSATSTVAVLTVTNVPVVVTNIAYLHTLQDANYALTNTTTLFQATGIVTTPANLVSGASVYSYHIQDATGGIDVFHRGGFSPLLPTVGDSVTVTAPLVQFNGLSEFAPTNANPTHSIVINSTGNPLPAPMVFDFTTINPALTESTFEGRYVVASNVFLGITNVPALITAGGNVFMTNLTGQIFRLFNPAPAIDPQGLAAPVFAASVRGVMTQGDSTSPFDSGYSIFLTLYSDIEVGTPPSPTPGPIVLNIQQSGANVVLTWTNAAYSLQASPSVSGTYTNIPSATTGYSTSVSGEQRYFRLVYP